ncbi:actin-related protein 8 [Nesidiocoris tenuis]|uniref:Actin-related protein 8 n=1 Tax=Nesidiocoris tenuis TaxID=355587 RepID=A0ABN7ALG1_9HEMI|nr:actin-related protein 8 [Nesidiocoris tenuis]
MSVEAEAQSEPGGVHAQNVIVIHPGSMYIKIGRASDLNPHTELHAIGRRRSPGGQIRFDTLLPTVPLNVDYIDIESDLDYSRLQISHTLQSFVMSTGQKRYATPPQQIAQFNRRSIPETLNAAGPQLRSPTADSLVGNDVLQLQPRFNYNVHFPWKRGDLNVHGNVGGSLTGVMADLQAIWSALIVEKLNIPVQEWKNFRAVLIIPVIYNRTYVREFVTLLLDMGFASCFLLQDHVAAAFGAGLGSACVIDCGHSKTSVSCVEDGLSNPATRVTLPYGGGDITQCFLWLLNRGGFPYKDCDSNNAYDAILIDKLKQDACHVDLDVCGSREKSFVVRQPLKPVLKYTIQIGDECMIAPLGLFYPELFCLTVTRTVLTQKRDTGDPSDPHDADYLRETGRKVTREQELVADSIGDEDIVDIEVTGGDNDFSFGQALSVDQAVIQSVQQCGNDDTKRKMFSTVLVVGGGMKFKGISSWLKNKLAFQVPPHLKPDQIDIITAPKDMDPVMATWKGAAIFACLESAQELWITQEDIRKHGVKILRERSAFIW